MPDGAEEGLMDGYFGRPGNTPGTFSYERRKARMRVLADLLAGMEAVRVLDLGGTFEFWEANARFLLEGTVSSLDVVNTILDRPEGLHVADGGLEIRMVAGDATEFHRGEGAGWDLVFSNSAIEHVGNLRQQRRFAQAVARAAPRHFIQTPSRSFPVEPHFHVPYFWALPLGLRAALHRRFDLGFMPREQDWFQARIDCEETRLLSRRELESLFPGSRILPERVYGFTKSWMVTNL